MMRVMNCVAHTEDHEFGIIVFTESARASYQLFIYEWFRFMQEDISLAVMTLELVNEIGKKEGYCLLGLCNGE